MGSSNRTEERSNTAGLIIALALLPAAPASSAPPRLLAGSDYIPAVTAAIAGARESIDIAMYFIIMDGSDPAHPVDALVEELAAARRRGVRVRVVLENEKFHESALAYKTLHAAGVDIAYDSPRTYLHSKALVVDGRICVVGSTNWSKTALRTNHELAVLFESTASARAVTQSLDALILERAPPVPAGTAGVLVPEALLLEPRAGRRMVRARDDHALSLYLEFLRQGAGTLPLDYATLASAIGHPAAARPTGVDYYEKLRRPLQRLDRKYRLLKFDGRKRTVSMGASGASFSVPASYWTTGAATRLSTRARYAYLIALYEAQNSVKNPYWFRSQKDLAKKYGLSDYTLSLGLLELERANALEVYRGESRDGGFGDRDANIYRVNPLVAPGELRRALAALEATHGAEPLRRARALADALDEPDDLTVIEVFLDLIREYGYEAVAAANARTAAFKKGSALRDVSTTVRALAAPWDAAY